MDIAQADVSGSDDEVFFGKLTIKEVRKRILFDEKQRQTISHVPLNPLDETNMSLKLIETQSEPDYISLRDSLTDESSQKSGPYFRQSKSSTSPEDSFLKLEEMVSELCTSETAKINEFDNTLEVVEYILNHGPGKQPDEKGDIERKDTKPDIAVQSEISLVTREKKHTNSPLAGAPTSTIVNTSVPPNTPKSEMKHLATPCKDAYAKTPIFKTPSCTLMPKKNTSCERTPSRHGTSKYQHIASPVAFYIKNCPQVSLIQDVRPKKPLPGQSSSIPKLLKSNSQSNLYNKENMNLPSLAYRSAKTTKMIDMPSNEKLPKSQLAKKIVSALPRPVVIKHNHRENNFSQATLRHQEDSFADLTLHQADVSVCTQKSAFSRPKNGQEKS